MNINYHHKVFKAISNTGSGQVTGDTLFHYYQEGTTLWAEYMGGEISRGQIIGKVAEDGRLRFHYQHIDNNGNLCAGYCQSKPIILEDGRIRLYESWEWTSGRTGSGESIIEEISYVKNE